MVIINYFRSEKYKKKSINYNIKKSRSYKSNTKRVEDYDYSVYKYL